MQEGDLDKNEKFLDDLWEHWAGSELLVYDGTQKSLVRQKNFLGGIAHYKKSFMKASKVFLKNKIIKDGGDN